MNTLRRLPFLLPAFFAVWAALPSSASAQAVRAKHFEHAAVVSATAEASRVGVDIMRRGGNAVDAAIAVHFALAVTFPGAGNIGGGGFMVVRLPDGETATLDFRETAPAAATETMYLDQSGEVIPGRSLIGHHASGVPGAVDGMVKAHRRYGSLPWHELVNPSVLLAQNGFALSWQEAQALNAARERFAAFPGSAEAFTLPEGQRWREGDTLRQPDLARTLERVARQGRAGFYEGETARLIVEEMQRGGGIITLADLQGYESVWRTPLRIRFRDYTLVTMPPPSSGGVAMGQILAMLDPYDLKAVGYHSAEGIHLLTETMRRAYADRAEHLGDPDFHPVPVAGLLDSRYLQSRMASFDPTKATPSAQLSHGQPAPPESEETTHFSIVDPQGTAVAVTTTLNGGYGSYVTVQGAGFLLNNEMDDFSSKPGTPNMYGLVGGKANAIAPGKRMLSSMTPTIVEQNGELRMVLGTPGGSTIITTVLQTFLNMAVYGMNAQQAVAAPRIHHQWLPDLLQVDPFSISPDTQALLRGMGHNLSERSSYAGRADCIFVDSQGRRWGGADPRGEDTASGY